jgi:hypothetical protein
MVGMEGKPSAAVINPSAFDQLPPSASQGLSFTCHHRIWNIHGRFLDSWKKLISQARF